MSKKLGDDSIDNTVIRQDSTENTGYMLFSVKISSEKPDGRTDFLNPVNANWSGVQAAKTPGRGFVLTRFLLPFHRLEKEEPVRFEDIKRKDQLITFPVIN